MAAGRIAVRLGIGLAAALMLAACGAAASPTPAPAASTAVVASPSPVATAAPATAAPTATPAPSPSLWAQGKSSAVTGTITCGTLVKAGTERDTGTPYVMIGHDLACTSALSDPRVSGSGTYNLSAQSWDPGFAKNGTNAVQWGYQTIKGPDGTWAGRCYGFYDKDGILRHSCMLAGDGGYKGLMFTSLGTVPANASTADVVGTVQPGMPLPGFMVTPLASGGTFPTGRWINSSEDGTPAYFDFEKNGTWKFTGVYTTGPELITSGTYKVSGEAFTYVTDTYCKAAGGQQGTYTWVLAGGALMFQVKNDPCTDRLGVMTSGMWVPAQ